jgi:tetratricopeptide (TPR) repeat protein
MVACVLGAVLLLPTCGLAADRTMPQEEPNAVAPAQSAPTRRTAPAARGQNSSRERLLSLASTELSAGRRAEAERLLLEAADRFDSVDALLRLGRLQAGRGDQQGALGSLRRARALAPNSEEVLSGFAQVSLAARAITPAILALQALTRICPTVAQYHYLLGVGLMQAGDFVAAVESLEQANRLEPNSGLTLIALGLGYNSRKLYAEARSYLLRGLELEPESVDAIAALAESEEGLGELDAAEVHARQALAKVGNHPNAHLVLGLLLMKRERIEEARDALIAAVSAEPLLAKAHYQLSLAYSRLGDAASAEKHLGLYRTSLRDVEQRLERIRLETGEPSKGGMGR